MVKRVLIAVGGTGGHVYPAVSLARKLKAEIADLSIIFAGGGIHDSRFFEQMEFPYHEVACGQFSIRKPLKSIKNLGKLTAGVWQSDRLIKQFQPDLVVGFGSYHSLPLLLAVNLRSIPIILHEGNAIPGRVNRLFSKQALVTGVQFPGAAHYLYGKTMEIENPLRNGLSLGDEDKMESLKYYHLSDNKKTVLVFGGSQGASALNKLICQALAVYSGDVTKLQVIHFTGNPEESQSVKQCYEKIGIEHAVKDFEPQIGKAWTLATLVIGRAGAGTIAEAMEFEVPAILVPYPHAMDNHQKINGDFFVEQVGGGVLLEQKGLTQKKLSSEIFYLIEQQPKRWLEMKESIRKYNRNVKQQDLSTLVAALIP